MTGGELNRSFFVNNISFVLSLLKVTFHVNAQVSIFLRSLLICAAVTAGSDPFQINVVSSANIKISLSKPSLISFMYNIKSRGSTLRYTCPDVFYMGFNSVNYDNLLTITKI